MKVINIWLTISNSNNKYDANSLGNAIIKDDGKLDFLQDFANFIEDWCASQNFSPSKQTANALVITLRWHAMLVHDLHSEGYDYVMMRRLQSDPIENRFSQYRSMSGGRFLVGLREVESSQRIIACRSLLKVDVDVWKLQSNDEDNDVSRHFLINLEGHEMKIMEASLDQESLEVSCLVAGFVGKNVIEKTKCNECGSHLVSDRAEYDGYLNKLSRGKLLKPTSNLSYVV